MEMKKRRSLSRDKSHKLLILLNNKKMLKKKMKKKRNDKSLIDASVVRTA